MELVVADARSDNCHRACFILLVRMVSHQPFNLSLTHLIGVKLGKRANIMVSKKYGANCVQIQHGVLPEIQISW